MSSTRPFIFIGLLIAGCATASAQEHQHDGKAPERLGKVHFETSCSTEAKPQFDRAVALLHSFWYPAAIEAFTTVLKTDPGCGIAYWGIALSHWGNPYGGTRAPKALQEGAAAIAKAKATGAGTDRERDYIAAVEELFRDAGRVDQRTRSVAYEKAMEQVARKYPQDSEASVFYALAVSGNALPSDKTYANQLKAAAILEKIFATQPDHPGIAHYIIHSYDMPALADRALDAARRYAKIAPSAPHALHMPSHTFTRVGYWQESIETNIASANAARAAKSPAEVLHAFDYQAYAYLQTAQDADAKRVLGEMETTAAQLDLTANYGPVGLYALAAIPARYALERSAWAEAAALEPRPSNFVYTDAITHFARAVGAARAGRAADARKDVERLAAHHATLVQAKETYWAEQVDIQRRVAEAWTLKAEGKTNEAIEMLRAAADLEDKTDKSAISPGPIAPARELLGEMLLEAGQAAEALKAFEATAAKEPNRFRGVYGVARAAEATGDTAKARKAYSRLVEICRKGDAAGRAELKHAKEFLAKS